MKLNLNKFNFYECRAYKFYSKRFINVFFPNKRTSFIMYVIAIGYIICSIYEYNLNKNISKLFLINLLSITSVVVGGLFGFLFGMPKNSHHDEHKNGDHKNGDHKKGNHPDLIKKDIYQENTNLQEISDWMTKIIVGVGLTQFRSIYEKYTEITLKISSENNIGTHTIVCMVTIYFYILGFFASYFWAKLDYNKIITSKLNKKINKISKNSEERDRINLKILEIASVLDSDKIGKETKKNYIDNMVDIVRSNPMHRMANIVLARFYAEVMDDYPAAIASLDKYILLKIYNNEKDMDLSDALYNKAFYLLKSGEVNNCISTLKACFDIYPQNKHFAKVDPDLTEIHNNPEFISIVK